MTKFTDGPAAGKCLQLRRIPLYLRVVRSQRSGAFDALDQLDDEPKAWEELSAYRLVESGGMIHINSRDPKTGRRNGGTYPLAKYALVADQPDDATMRDAKKWQAWCYREYGRVKCASKSAEFVIGYSTADMAFSANQEHTVFVNPFEPGTEQHRGYEEGVYDFTQK